jgi:hypothetical protein
VILLGNSRSMSKFQDIRFREIEDKVPNEPGIYKIYTNTGIALKVGISANIRRRLMQHRVSRQNRLLLKTGGDRGNPSDVLSKESILSKHLYYDESINDAYELMSENGRQKFLVDNCYIRFMATETKEDARKIEKQLENCGQFRYEGRVKKL